MTGPFDPERDRWSIEATELLLPPIARKIFNTSEIEYAWGTPDIDRLDKEYGVDALLKTPKRNVSLAIRIRGRYYYDSFRDVTIRYDSLQTLGKALELQKSIARFMFYGWADTNSPGIPKKLIEEGKVDPATIKPATCLVNWYIIFLQRLIDKNLREQIKFSGPFSNGDSSSRLVGFSLDDLKQHNLIYWNKDKPIPVVPTDPLMAANSIKRYFSEDQLSELIELLS